MKRKFFNIIFLSIMAFSPILGLFLMTDNEGLLNFPFPDKYINPNNDLTEDTVKYITNSSINGTRDPLSVNQTCTMNKTELDWTVQNDMGDGPAPAPQVPAGNITRDYNITAIDDYNRTSYEITIQNITMEPTWKDVEENTSSVTTGSNYVTLDDSGGFTPSCAAMEFNITKNTRLINISYWGRTFDSGADNWYVEIWNRSLQWQGDPATMLVRLTSSSSTTPKWQINTFNLNLTPASYFLVLNGSELDDINGDFIRWSYSTDSVDDGDAYVYIASLGGWNAYADDLSMKIQTVEIDSNNDTLKNVDAGAINLNLTVDGTDYQATGTKYTKTFSGLNEAGNKLVTLTANHSFSCNLTWTSGNFNSTETTTVIYNATAPSTVVDWNFNFSVNYPVPNYGETITNYNVTIYKPDLSWDMFRALNASDINVTKGIVEGPQTIFLSNNTDPILTDGLWKFSCFNPIQSILFDWNRTVIAVDYPANAYVHGETIQINVSAAGFIDGYVNLSIFNKTGHDVTADWTATEDLPFNNFALFNVTVPASAPTDNYTITAVWSNDIYVGLNGSNFIVVNDTELLVINENEVNGEQIVGNEINLTVYFNDTHSNAPITGANVTFQLYNETDHSIVTQAFLDESATAGYYNYTISTSDYVNGSYQLLINASKDWYNNQSITRNFTLVYDTQIANITPGVTNIIGFFPDNLTISVNYSTHNPGEIENAIVNFTTNQTTVEGVLNGSLIWDPSSKTYNVTLNSTDFDVNYVYEINVSAWKEGYLAQLVTFYWNLTIGQTELIVYLNNTGFEYEQFIELSAYYNDTIHNSGIAGASVNVTCSWNNTMLTMNPSTPDGNYTIIFDTSLIGVEQGPLGFLVNAVKPKYEYQENNTYNSVPLNKQSTTKVNLNGSALNNAIYDVYWGETFFVNVSYHRSDDSLITGTATAIGNWTIPGTQYRSLTNGFYIFEVPLNGSNLNPPITHAGLWGLNFTVNSTNYATAFEDFTVNITTLTHLNASDSAGKSYNNTLTYEGEFANITIYYNDTIFDQQLATYTIMSNWSVISNYLTDFTGSGYCNISLNTTGIAPGDYSVTINASALNYQFQEIIVNITIKEKYNVTIINFDDTIEGSYVPGDSVDIIIRILNGSNPIVGFVVNITINASTPINLQFSTNASGYITYQYSVRSEDVGSALNITIIFPEAFEYNSNSTSYIITIEQAKREQLFPPLLGGKGLDPIILFIVIGAVAVGIIAVVAVVGAKKRKEKIELEKKKTISSVTDVANIRHILVIHKGTGIDIFNYAVEKGLDPTLISGFIQAVKGFGKELSRKATGEECKE